MTVSTASLNAYLASDVFNGKGGDDNKSNRE